MGKAFEAGSVKKRVNRNSVNGYSVYKMEERTTFTCHGCSKDKTVMKVARNDEEKTMLCRACFQKILSVPKKDRKNLGNTLPESLAKPEKAPSKRKGSKSKAPAS
eukprot:TRINITY_DN13410_c0_g2_i1.p1 TRINITY_DN13410_c0_g2~~TRINITY_DN13410_c0_g2_i1.p1  ORF type:complete len:105 (+),score=44.46 TRINITY_DN13410_c0_g2_i1:65-379(+)